MGSDAVTIDEIVAIGGSVRVLLREDASAAEDAQFWRILREVQVKYGASAVAIDASPPDGMVAAVLSCRDPVGHRRRVVEGLLSARVGRR